jgi:hypothetical protein
MSHNGILVEGRGACLRGFRDAYPYSARPLFWKESEGMVAWSIDLTGTFLCEPGKGGGGYNYAKNFPDEWGYPDLAYWRRHFLFVRDRYLAVYDEIGVREGTAPARFTWLHHFPPGVEARADGDGKTERTLAYRVGDVRAAVFQRSSGDCESGVVTGRDTLVNPITGTDFWPAIEKAYAIREKAAHSWEQWADQVWSVRTQPVRRATFLTVLAPSRGDGQEPIVTFPDDATAEIADDRGSAIVSFAGNERADYRLDAAAIDAFADASDPFRLPGTGPEESVRAAGAALKVTWLRKDDFQDPAWVNRWAENGRAVVYADRRGLHVDALREDSRLTLTAPLPPRAVLSFLPETMAGEGEVVVEVGGVRVPLDLNREAREGCLVTVSDGRICVYDGSRAKRLHEAPFDASGSSPKLVLETSGMAITWKTIRIGSETGKNL